MLAACVAAGWDTGSYLAPDHPLQQSVAAQVERLSGEVPVATGIDGCGKGYVTGWLVKSILKRAFQAYYDLSFWIECSFATA